MHYGKKFILPLADSSVCFVLLTIVVRLYMTFQAISCPRKASKDYEVHFWTELKRIKTKPLKGPSYGLRILKSCLSIFHILCLESMLIFSILSHPCSFMVYHYLFGVFLSY